MAKRSELPTGYFWRGPVIWCRTDPITGKQTSTNLRDPKGVRAWERKREREAEDPEVVASSTANLGEWVAKTIAIKEANKSKATVKIYRQKLASFVKFWGEKMPLINITPSACDDYAKHRLLKVSGHTVVKEFSALAQLLKAAKRVGCYPHDISTLRPPTVVQGYVPRERHLSWPEVELLVEECSPKLGAIVVLAVTIGARLSEALRFDPKRDLDRNWVAHIRGTKTDSADDYIPVLAPFRPMLTSALGAMPVVEFKNNLRRNLLAACKRAGIDPCTPNDLRRTFCSLLIAAGVDKETARRFMRHKTSRMVEMVYGKVTPKGLEKLTEHALPSLLLGDGSATKSATVIETVGETMQPEPISGANSEGRTRDLRFTKPKSQRGNSRELSENKPNVGQSTLSDTPPELGTTATVNATVEDNDTNHALIALDRIMAAWEAVEFSVCLEETARCEAELHRVLRSVAAKFGWGSCDVDEVGP
jgi:integrase